MAVKIVKAKNLDMRCWSAKLYLGLCRECERFKKCRIWTEPKYSKRQRIVNG